MGCSGFDNAVGRPQGLFGALRHILDLVQEKTFDIEYRNAGVISLDHTGFNLWTATGISQPKLVTCIRDRATLLVALSMVFSCSCAEPQ